MAKPDDTPRWVRAPDGLARGTTYWRWNLAPLIECDPGRSTYCYLLLTCAEITEQVVAHRQVAAERQRLEALHAVAEAIAPIQEPREVAQAARRALGKALSAPLVGVYVHDPGRRALVALGRSDDLPPDVEAELSVIPIDDEGSPAVRTFRDGQMRSLVLAPGCLADRRLQLASKVGVRSLVCAPLKAGDECLGVVIACRTEPVAFGKEDLDLLGAACRRVAGALVRAEARHLRAIMENTQAHLAYLDRDFTFVRVNSSYVRGCGHSKAEFIGRNHFDLFPNAENQAIFERARDTGETYQVLAKPFEYVDQPWRGTTYWDWTLTAVKDSAGRVEGLVFSLVDVTESIRLKEEAQRRAAELEAILGSIADGVVLYNPSGDLVGMNPPAEKMLGRSFSEERQITDLAQRVARYGALDSSGRPFPPEHMPCPRALRGETVTGVEISVRRPNGSSVDLLCSAAPVRHPTGELAGAVVILQDITPLRELDRLKDEFISVASHELKSPLTSTKGFCQVLMRRAEKHPGCERCMSNLRTVDTQVNRVVRLVDQLLDLSRLQVGRMTLSREPTDLIEVAAEAAANAQVTTPPPPDPGAGRGRRPGGRVGSRAPRAGGREPPV